MRLQLVAYDVGGARRGPVPMGLGLTRYLTLGETPTLQAEYTALQDRTDRLQGPVEVAFQYSNRAEAWVEPINGRYVIDSEDFDRVDNGQMIHRYTFLGVVAMLKYADVGVQSLDAEGRRKFTDKTPGYIMKTLIDEAQAAGLLTLLDYDFTATTTSSGGAWAKTMTRTLEPEHDLLSLIESFQEGGLADFWTSGRTLRMGNPDTYLDRDLTLGDNPVYIRDQGLTASPENISYADILTKVRVIGDNGSRWTFTNAEATNAFGPRIATLEASGVSDTATAQTYAEEMLKAGQDPVRSLTREFTVLDSTLFVPDRDFRIGDWIKADTAEEQGEKVRVVATSLREESGETKAFVTVGAVKDALALRVAKLLKKAAGGDRDIIGDRSGDGSNWGSGDGAPFDDPWSGLDDRIGSLEDGLTSAGGGGNMYRQAANGDNTWPARHNDNPALCVVWVGPAAAADPPIVTSGTAGAYAGDHRVTT